MCIYYLHHIGTLEVNRRQQNSTIYTEPTKTKFREKFMKSYQFFSMISS